MGGSRGVKVGVAALLAVLGLGLGALLWDGGTDNAGAAEQTDLEATRYLLRLTDLPPGYSVLPFLGPMGEEGSLSNAGCGSYEPAEPGPVMVAFIRAHRPRGCFGAYWRTYRTPVPGPYPRIAGTGALETGSVEGAREAVALAPLILRHYVKSERSGAIPGLDLGGPEPLRAHPSLAPFGDGEPGTFLVWRSGSVVGVVLATGRSKAGTERDALALARLQQPHLEHPAPYTEAEHDDSEVALDNPALTRPVYWLGRELAPGRGLPRLRLSWSGTSSGKSPARQSATITYSHGAGRPRGSGLVDLQVFTSERWRSGRGLANRLSKPPLECARVRTVDLERGRATLYGTYRRVGRRCPTRPPRRFHGHAFVGRSVVAINSLPGCPVCAVPSGPYNSFKGMEAIVRGLKQRRQTVFASGR
jgi:hypothetical protein